MAPRSDRDNPHSSNAPYSDDYPAEDAHLNSQDTEATDHDALSFMRIDDQLYNDDDEEQNMPWQVKAVGRFPQRLQRVWRAVVKWTAGPQPPRPWRITPLFEELQTYPLRIRDQYFPKRIHKFGLLMVFYGCWLLTFSLVLRRSAFAAQVKGHGRPHIISCAARFWARGNGCGRDGDICRPFDKSEFIFRCPASCDKVTVHEPYPVGAQEINYRPIVVGGPMDNSAGGFADAVYRGDSFICASAIHAGFIKNQQGGCGVVKMVGERSKYPSVKQHRILSIAFDSWFPQSFTFTPGTSAQCKDLRWPLLVVSVIYTAILSLFTTSPAVFFWSIFTGLFTHVALVSDPPGNSDYRTLISTATGRFVPAAFCMAVMYLASVRFTLRGLRAQVEKTILWLGACWVGSLNNYTFDKIPIQRLTPHDLQQQPGAVPALIIIVLVILSIALSQAWFIRIEGLMQKYLGIYGLLCGGLLLCLAVPDLKIRIHHYILALLLLPGTRLQMRPSMLYQGLLVGFFINGIARWGFDSLLQTSIELRGDAPINSALPTILPPIVQHLPGSLVPTNITFEWTYPSNDTESINDPYTGISILVNEVERYRGQRGEDLDEWTWRRTRQDLPEYFRFAYVQGGDTLDYTKAGTWDASGGWKFMESGPSG